MPDYSKGFIYQIICKDPNVKEIYVGSSCNYNQRLSDHKSKCNNPNNDEYNKKVYQHIRENSGFDNFEIEIIEYFPCDSKLELEIREDFWMNTLQSTLNCKRAGLDQSKKEYLKEYREANKEYLSEKHKEWREKNKEQIAEQKKQYCEKNKEQIAKRKKEYYEKNKEQIWLKRKEKYTCVCGKIYTHNNKSRHYNSEFHLDFIENKI